MEVFSQDCKNTHCLVDPCDSLKSAGITCANAPGAECRLNKCGCEADWYIDGEKIKCELSAFGGTYSAALEKKLNDHHQSLSLQVADSPCAKMSYNECSRAKGCGWNSRSFTCAEDNCYTMQEVECENILGCRWRSNERACASDDAQLITSCQYLDQTSCVSAYQCKWNGLYCEDDQGLISGTLQEFKECKGLNQYSCIVNPKCIFDKWNTECISDPVLTAECVGKNLDDCSKQESCFFNTKKKRCESRLLIAGLCSHLSDETLCAETHGCLWRNKHCEFTSDHCTKQRGEEECALSPFCEWDGKECHIVIKNPILVFSDGAISPRLEYAKSLSSTGHPLIVKTTADIRYEDVENSKLLLSKGVNIDYEEIPMEENDRPSAVRGSSTPRLDERSPSSSERRSRPRQEIFRPEFEIEEEKQWNSIYESIQEEKCTSLKTRSDCLNAAHCLYNRESNACEPELHGFSNTRTTVQEPQPVLQSQDNCRQHPSDFACKSDSRCTFIPGQIGCISTQRLSIDPTCRIFTQFECSGEFGRKSECVWIFDSVGTRGQCLKFDSREPQIVVETTRPTSQQEGSQTMTQVVRKDSCQVHGTTTTCRSDSKCLFIAGLIGCVSSSRLSHDATCSIFTKYECDRGVGKDHGCQWVADSVGNGGRCLRFDPNEPVVESIVRPSQTLEHQQSLLEEAAMNDPSRLASSIATINELGVKGPKCIELDHGVYCRFSACDWKDEHCLIGNWGLEYGEWGGVHDYGLFGIGKFRKYCKLSDEGRDCVVKFCTMDHECGYHACVINPTGDKCVFGRLNSQRNEANPNVPRIQRDESPIVGMPSSTHLRRAVRDDKDESFFVAECNGLREGLCNVNHESGCRWDARGVCHSVFEEIIELPEAEKFGSMNMDDIISWLEDHLRNQGRSPNPRTSSRQNTNESERSEGNSSNRRSRNQSRSNESNQSSNVRGINTGNNEGINTDNADRNVRPEENQTEKSNTNRIVKDIPEPDKECDIFGDCNWGIKEKHTGSSKSVWDYSLDAAEAASQARKAATEAQEIANKASHDAHLAEQIASVSGSSADEHNAKIAHEKAAIANANAIQAEIEAQAAEAHFSGVQTVGQGPSVLIKQNKPSDGINDLDAILNYGFLTHARITCSSFTEEMCLRYSFNCVWNSRTHLCNDRGSLASSIAAECSLYDQSLCLAHVDDCFYDFKDRKCYEARSVFDDSTVCLSLKDPVVCHEHRFVCTWQPEAYLCLPRTPTPITLASRVRVTNHHSLPYPCQALARIEILIRGTAYNGPVFTEMDYFRKANVDFRARANQFFLETFGLDFNIGDVFEGTQLIPFKLSDEVYAQVIDARFSYSGMTLPYKNRVLLDGYKVRTLDRDAGVLRGEYAKATMKRSAQLSFDQELIYMEIRVVDEWGAVQTTFYVKQKFPVSENFSPEETFQAMVSSVYNTNWGEGILRSASRTCAEDKKNLIFWPMTLLFGECSTTSKTQVISTPTGTLFESSASVQAFTRQL